MTESDLIVEKRSSIWVKNFDLIVQQRYSSIWNPQVKDFDLIVEQRSSSIWIPQLEDCDLFVEHSTYSYYQKAYMATVKAELRR